MAGGYHGAMSRLLLNLRHVLDDEADDVRAMLDANGIAFHETPPSLWGISAGGIFVPDEAFADAKRLMAEYQARRSERVRAELDASPNETIIKLRDSVKGYAKIQADKIREIRPSAVRH